MAVEGEHRRSGYLFSQRLLLLICAVAISLPVLYKSRPGRETSATAAFAVQSSAHAYVRITGDVRYPGIYPISVNTMTVAAMEMAGASAVTMKGISAADAASRLENGESLNIAVHADGTVLLTTSRMNTNERLVMGIPLDINAMSESDLDRVPGIGPVMARRIIEYRQNNGGIMTVTDLNSVEGIGEKKYNQLRKLF